MTIRPVIRRAAAVAGLVVTVLLAAVLVAHLPAVRSAVLRRVVATVERDFGIRVDAERLDYNIAALRVGLANMRLSAPGTVAEPFVTADYVSAVLSTRALFGDLAFAEVRGDNVRVLVLRRADGTTNLPASTGEPSNTEPAPLRIARIDMPRLSVDVRDERDDLALSLPSVSLLLTADEGRIALLSPGEVRRGAQSSRLSQLDGGMRFDGRAIHLSDVQLTSDELSLVSSGSVTVLARDPAIDLQLRGTGEAAALSGWALLEDGDRPRGTLSIDGSVAGPFADLRAQLSVASEMLEWQQLTATDLAADVDVTSSDAAVSALRLGLAGGRVDGSGRVVFTGGEVNANASWTGVNAETLMRALVRDAPLVVSGAVDGRLEANGAGAAVEGWTVTTHLDVAPGSNRTNVVSLAGPMDLALEDGAWRLVARQTIGRAVPVALSVRGTVSADTIAGSPVNGTLVVDPTNLPALVDALRTIGLADVDQEIVAGGQAQASLAIAGSLGRPTIDGDVALRDVRGAQVDLPAAEMHVSGSPAEPDLAFEASAPAGNIADQAIADFSATGRIRNGPPDAAAPADSGVWLEVEHLALRDAGGVGTLTGNAAYGFRGGQYAASLTGTGWTVVATEERPVSGLLSLQLSGQGTIEDLRASGSVSVIDARVRDVDVGRLDADVALEGRTAVIRATAPRFSATADARIGVDAPYTSTIDASAGPVDVEQLLRDLGLSFPVVGTTMATVHATGPLEDWQRATAVVDVSSLDLTSHGSSMSLEEPARLTYDAGQLLVQRFEASIAGIRTSAFGSIPVFDPRPDSAGVIVTATGQLEDVARAAAAAGLTQSSLVQGTGPAALLARIGGTASAPLVSADLDVGPGVVNFEDLPAISDIRLRVHAADGWVELQDGSASYQDATIAAVGKAPIALLTSGDRAGDATLRARAANVTPAVLATFVGPDGLQQVSGSIDATLEASSPTLELADVAGELRLDRFDLRVADLPVTQQQPTRLVARDGVLRVESWDWAGQGATLAVRGEVRMREREAAISAGGTVDLRVLTPFIRDAGISTAGRFVPRLSITGPLSEPLVEGDVAVDGGELRLVDPRVLVSDLNLNAVVSRTSAHILSLNGAINGGSLTGGGAVEYTEKGLNAQISMDVREMALEAPQGLRSDLDAELALSSAVPVGTGTAMSSRLSGVVTVRRGTYREPLALLTGLAAGLRTRVAQGAGAAGSPFLDTLALDVRLLTDEDLIVDNNYARVEVGADVRVGGTASAPAMAGRAEVREGGRLFVGRNMYTVTQGTVDFISPVAIEPSLNVEAVTRAGGEEIVVTLTGPAESPTVELRSTTAPELGQADLTSILLTGRTLDELAPDDAAFVGSQVVGNLSAEVLGFAGRAFGLDALRLGGVETSALRTDAAAVAADVDPTSRLTFGKNIGTDVELTFSQSLRNGDAQTLVVQYDPVRNVELRVVSNDENLRSYGFRNDLQFGTPPPTRDVQRPAGRGRETLRVTRVEISGDLALEERRVRQAVHLEPGDRFDYVEWLDDRDRLDALYRTAGHLSARIASRRIDEADGVALVFEIAAGPRTRLEVTGIDADGALRARIEALWAEAVFDEFLFDDVRGAVGADLARRGYLQPAIDVRLNRTDSEHVLSVAVTPGARTGRTEVRLAGVPDGLEQAIMARLRAGGLIDNAAIDPARVAGEVRDYLRSAGYLQAAVTAGVPVFGEAAAVVPVTVDAGARFVLGRLAVVDQGALPEETVRDAAGLMPGEPYDPAAVDAATDRLRVFYRGQGFPAATVFLEPTVRTEAGVVDVAIEVTAGPRQIVSDVVVVGNREIDTDVVLRTLGLSAGEPLTAAEMIAARTRVAETGLFRRLDLTPEPLEAGATPAESPVRVRVAVEEWPALRLRYGFVVAEERPEGEVEGRTLVPGVSADLTRRTLFGRAVTVGGAFDLQRLEQRGRIFLSSPTLAGLPIGSSIVAERSREEFSADTLVTDRSRVSWEQRLRLNPRMRLFYSYSFERNHTRDTAPPEDPEFVFDETVNIARLTAGAAWDTRDDPADTTQGLLVTSSFDFAPEALGSDIRFVRELVQAYAYRRAGRVVLASAGRWGIVAPLGGQDLIPSERFYAGGSRTLRGVAEDGLGPRDFFGAAGGRAMLLLNQEVRVPVYRWFRGVGFLDAGNVFARTSDTSLRDLVGAVGVGLRIATPYALLRVDFGRTVWGATPEVGGTRWTFGLGHAF